MNSIKNVCFMIALSAVLFISCKEKVNVEVEQTTTPDTTVQATQEVVQGNETAVSLNNGVQWEVDDQITNGIKEMQKSINDLPAAEESRNYQGLREELERKFSELFANTSLTGDARTQFENYMTPVKILLSDLGSPDVATRQDAVQKIKAHLESFNDYFL